MSTKNLFEVNDSSYSIHYQVVLSCIGEGNGNPLQCSCLENPRDGGAWWAAIYGVTQSWTRLKWLSSSSSTLTLLPGYKKGYSQTKCLPHLQTQKKYFVWSFLLNQESIGLCSFSCFLLPLSEMVDLTNVKVSG